MCHLVRRMAYWPVDAAVGLLVDRGVRNSKLVSSVPGAPSVVRLRVPNE